VNFGDDDWAREAMFLERHRKLSPVLGVARMGAHCLGHGTVGFSSGARETVCSVVSLVDYGVGQGVCCVRCTMSCTCRCGAGRSVMCARGNTHAGLGIPGHRLAHAERGRGVAYRRFGRQRPIG
jgi:hypothetical protein